MDLRTLSTPEIRRLRANLLRQVAEIDDEEARREEIREEQVSQLSARLAVLESGQPEWVSSAVMARILEEKQLIRAGLPAKQRREELTNLAGRNEGLRKLARPSPEEVPDGKRPPLIWPVERTVKWFEEYRRK